VKTHPTSSHFASRFPYMFIFQNLGPPTSCLLSLVLSYSQTTAMQLPASRYTQPSSMSWPWTSRKRCRLFPCRATRQCEGTNQIWSTMRPCAPHNPTLAAVGSDALMLPAIGSICSYLYFFEMRLIEQVTDSVRFTIRLLGSFGHDF
jgi:hypothetical protein